MTKLNLTRETIVKALVDALKRLEYVHAFYEGGAISHGRLDEWSDVDAYVVVDDDKSSEAFQAVEKTLQSLSPIKQKYDVPQTGFQGIVQAFYRLERASEYLVIDLAVVTLSAPDKLLEPKVHGPAKFYFNKNNRIQPPSFDKAEFTRKLQIRLDQLKARFSMFNCFIQKEINRGNFVEAIDLYHNLTLGLLVEVLRIKHNPIHHDFKTRYIHHELPPEIVSRLKRLYFVKDEKDLKRKYDEANRWFQETIVTIRHERTTRQPDRS